MGRDQTIGYLRDLITRLEDEIVALSTDQLEARQKINQIRALQASIDNTPPQPSPQKYARYKRAVDAVTDYLKEISKPVPQQALIDELVKGGFRVGQPDAWVDVKKSVRHHTQTPQGLGKERLKEVNGLVGLYGWPEEMFK